MNWQRVHEDAINMMNTLAGDRVYDLDITLQKITNPVIREMLIDLNRENDFAVDMYYGGRLKKMLR